MSSLDEDFLDQAVSKHQSETSQSEVAKWIGWGKLIIGLLVGSWTVMFAVITWATFIQSSVGYEKDERLKLTVVVIKNTSDILANTRAIDAAAKALELKDSADKRTYDNLKAFIDTNIVVLDKLQSLMPKIEEMWFMKSHGISNRDSFLQEHGYPAPPSIDETHTPTKKK